VSEKNGNGFHVEMMSIDDVVPYERNPRINEGAVVSVANSIREFGFRQPIVVDESMIIIVGHTRLLAARSLSMTEVPVHVATGLTESQKRAYRIADNKVAELSGWDDDLLAYELNAIAGDIDMQALGFTGDEINHLVDGDDLTEDKQKAATLSDDFLVPPFSVLDGRQGYWRDRKRRWISLGIKSEEGRFDGEGKKTFGTEGYLGDSGNVSIFDPVLCELAYLWFTGPGFHVLDPFAGGSVRGLVASILGRKYTGVDLRESQVESNRDQASEILTGAKPIWIVGDSRNIGDLAPGAYDFVFSCPPYGDFEVYSHTPGDLSNMPVDEFDTTYREIVARSCAMLKDNRFAIFVVGDYRGRDGAFRNFVSKTIGAFQDAGLRLWNEAIYLNPNATLPLRARRPFEQTRKLGKGHQNVLVFVKGDARAAAEACGNVHLCDSIFGDEPAEAR